MCKLISYPLANNTVISNLTSLKLCTVGQMTFIKFKAFCDSPKNNCYKNLVNWRIEYKAISIMYKYLKMISSPYCTVSEPNVYKHYKRLTRWNANRCYSLRITYLIFETFQTLFPTASLIFTTVRVFIK